MVKEEVKKKIYRLKKQKILNNVEIKRIDDINLIEKGVTFDNEHTCFQKYSNINNLARSLIFVADNYGIYYKDKYIGYACLHLQHYNFSEKLEIGICIKEEFRNLGIGKYCYDNLIRIAFEKDEIKSIHLSIKEGNEASIRLAQKCGFNEYSGYKSCAIFEDVNGNAHPQLQFLLKKKDYKKKKN